MGKNPHAVALGRKGGQSTSDAKADAARANGAKGGRPKKIAQLVEAAEPSAKTKARFKARAKSLLRKR